jgi:tetratricopeptide (TPR) repeat protein
MRNSLILRSSAIALLLSLGGCQFFGKLNIAHGGSQEQQRAAQTTRTMASSLAEGREHLRANRNGLAIDAFNLALVRGEDPAAAYNGLGVAYARVGRNDLAYRFFKKASTSDPDNPVYASNLIRLVDSPAFALNQIDRAPATPPARLADKPVSASAAAPRVPGKLHREGRGQFTLTTRPDEAMTAPDQRGAAMPQVAARTKVPNAPLAPATPTDESVVAKSADPVATPASGKRKVIDVAPAATAQPVQRNAAS